ncbi:MAG: O-antigen ligase family protein [Bacteriovorax sp.]|nr:O-antigen ligase family protein [Bacteriovorax sp.]
MNSKLSVSKLVDACCITLLILIFVSKVSLKWARIIPYSIPPFIFQYGLHPFINFGLQFFITLILIYIWLKQKHEVTLSPIYKSYIYSLMAVLSIQTMFQITLVNIGSSVMVQIAGLGMALMLILVYGIIIPTLFDIKKFVFWITKICVTLVVASFLCLPFFFGDMFRGGRFVGFFKHIPHMVSASTAAFIFFFPNLFSDKKWTLKNNTPLKLVIIFILALAVLLTSTKAAFGTIAITGFVGIFLFGSKKKSIRLFKFSFLACFLVSVLLIGAPTSQFMYEVTTGKTGFGLRKAQDGVQSRMEEVTRGWSMFEKSPYFGLGLLYKFLNNSQDGIEVESYNSFKDPHNLFVSAAVIGGYPLFFFAIIGYILMIFGAFRGINQTDPNKQIIGLFLLSHLPVFVIYHAHFSLGGIADRIYWLSFGYLGQYWHKNSEIMP